MEEREQVRDGGEQGQAEKDEAELGVTGRVFGRETFDELFLFWREKRPTG